MGRFDSMKPLTKVFPCLLSGSPIQVIAKSPIAQLKLCVHQESNPCFLQGFPKTLKRLAPPQKKNKHPSRSVPQLRVPEDSGSNDLLRRYDRTMHHKKRH